jgi:hypothetical protein
VYHHVSREQPHRYLSELDFRYNACKAPDSERASLALRGINGKRLTYRDSCRGGTIERQRPWNRKSTAKKS